MFRHGHVFDESNMNPNIAVQPLLVRDIEYELGEFTSPGGDAKFGG